MKKIKKNSISVEFLRLIIVAAVGVGILFWVLGLINTSIIERYFENETYVQKKNSEMMDELVNYIEENQVSVSDKNMLTKWIRKNPLVTLQIFKDGTLRYDSTYPDMEATWSVAQDDYYGWQTCYKVSFTDGEADVFISGYYGYHFYVLSMILRLALSAVLFLLIIMLGMRKTIQYICTLSREVEILEGGDLDYEITVSGHNELTELAKGLDAMRLSLKEQMENKAQIMKEHTMLITGMSHDLRTPLTSLLLYTEILKKRIAGEDKEWQRYVEKIEIKGKHLKQLTDNLFEYAIAGTEQRKPKVHTEKFREAFYEHFSDMYAYLEQNQFRMTIKYEPALEDMKLRIDLEYLNRIFDNFMSNIIKYGDRSDPVRVLCLNADTEVQIIFENTVSEEKSYKKGTHIGLVNVENMMRSMGGSTTVEEDGKIFRVHLRFPLIKQDDEETECS